MLYIFMGVRVFKSANFINTRGKVFSATLLAMALSLLLSLSFGMSVGIKVKEGQTQSQNIENLEKIIAADHKIGHLMTISQYLFFVYCGLLITGLALQYRSGQIDRTFLALFVITLLVSLMCCGLGSWTAV
ncbi:MAG: hypothetical protein PG981_000592 [Wolbachia endosymbiont of Ctenocephalides orientis wCori]|nr:MAG: hypothetical protein PG981_000592 [Wolbachia endosymbiont of Ctenocephalides orientis wCori]